jgi:peptidoglycan/LPS O-acetylase OafA/YrhL
VSAADALAEPAAPRAGDEAARLLVLDGLRGLAILLVMQHHFWGLAFGLSGRRPELGIDVFASRVIGAGWFGVDLFFVLSGFLITGILYDAKRSAFFFRNFYARRFLRIFPLYYLFLVIILFLFPLWPRIAGPLQISKLQDTQLWFWTYMVNNASGIKQFDAQMPAGSGQFWSLAVEEQFYLVWPFLVLLLSRRMMMGLCAVLVVGALALRYVLTDPVSASFANLNASHVLLPARVDTLALGALLALGLRGGFDLARLKGIAYGIIAVAAVVLVTLAVRHDGLSTLDRDVETYGFSLLAFLFASLLVLAVTSRPGDALHRVFTHSSLRFLGKYSYAIYVFHLAIAFNLAAEFLRRDYARTVFGSQIPFNVCFAILCSAVSIAAAWLSWHLFEKQVLKLKRYVPYGRTARPAEAPAAAPGDLRSLDLAPPTTSPQA